MSDYETLTPRELESLKYIALPFSVAASRMNIAESTYKTFIVNCSQKMLTHNRVQLLCEVLKRGYIKFEDLELPDVWTDPRERKVKKNGNNNYNKIDLWYFES